MNTIRRLFPLFTLVFFAVFFANSGMISAQEGPVTCWEAEPSSDQIADWVQLQIGYTGAITGISFEAIEMADGIHIKKVFRYVSGPDEGKEVTWSGVMPVTSTCTPEFEDKTSDLNCESFDGSQFMKDAKAGLIPGIPSLQVWIDEMYSQWYPTEDAATLEWLYENEVPQTFATLFGTGIACLPKPGGAAWTATSIETMLYIYPQVEGGYSNKPITFELEYPSGATQVVGTSEVGYFGDIAFQAVSQEYPLNKDYGVYQTPDGPKMVSRIYVAKLNGKIIERVLITPNFGEFFPEVYVIYADPELIARQSTSPKFATR